jgi:hypothetical protein
MSVTIETATDRMTEPFREKVLRKCAESEKRIAFPAVPLMTDIATMTAISNDLDSTRVYATNSGCRPRLTMSRWFSAAAANRPT